MSKGQPAANYLLGVLMFILVFNQVDRIALGLVLQDVKIDLALSDTQLGLLSGIAFALFYSIVGIPIARWADSGNRILIIFSTTALWSTAVILCGFSANFAQLLLIRTIVAIGEAGCIPPAQSLIAECFSRAERPRALARYMLGIPLSIVIGSFAAGWLNETYDWRATFMLLGVPGLLLAPLALLTLREPRKARSAHSATAKILLIANGPQLQQALRTLWMNRSFRHLLIAFSIMSFFNYGITKWMPTFFIRSHGLDTRELGMWLMVTYGLGGLLGTYVGGELATKYAAENERLQLNAMAAIFCIWCLLSAFVYLTRSLYSAFAALAIVAIGVSAIFGPLFAMIQSLVPERLRATAVALTYLFANLIGMGLGPLAAGFLSDVLNPWAQENSLRYALLALCPGYLWSAWHLRRAGRTIESDLEVQSAYIAERLSHARADSRH